MTEKELKKVTGGVEERTVLGSTVDKDKTFAIGGTNITPDDFESTEQIRDIPVKLK